MGVEVWGSGFSGRGCGFKFQGSELRVEGTRLGVCGLQSPFRYRAGGGDRIHPGNSGKSG